MNRHYRVHKVAAGLALSATLIASLGYSAAFPLPAQATPASQSADTLAAKEAQAKDAREKLDALAIQAEIASEDLHVIQEELATIEEQINTTTREIEETQAELSITQHSLAHRVSAAYKAGNANIIEVLLGATSFEDFASRVYYIESIHAQDAQTIAQAKELKANLAAKQESLETRLAEQKDLEAKAQARMQELDQAQARYLEITSSLDAEISELIQKQRDEIEAQEAQVLAQNDGVHAAPSLSSSSSNASNSSNSSSSSSAGSSSSSSNSASASSSSSSSSNSSSNPSSNSSSSSSASKPQTPSQPVQTGAPGQARPELISTARQFLGTPYQWGGNGPSTFDCSGFTCWVYREHGIRLPRTSRQQYQRIVDRGHLVTKVSQLQVGDLVFFGNPVHHVGIYIGNGKYIHAPQTGDVVKISSLGSSFVGGGSY